MPVSSFSDVNCFALEFPYFVRLQLQKFDKFMLALFHLFVFRLVLFLRVDFHLHIKNEHLHVIRSNNYLLTANYEIFYNNLYTQTINTSY